MDLSEENRLLRLGNALLRVALREVTDDLADMIEGHYRETKSHPAMKERYDRDMAVVIVARMLLKGDDALPPTEPKTEH